MLHPKLFGDPTDRSRFGALAFQRAGHVSPTQIEINHNKLQAKAEIEWMTQQMNVLEVVARDRVTEYGAEAVALAYVHAKAGWVVKRICRRGESADWLMQSGRAWLALEISGTASGDALSRLAEKMKQVAQCSLPTNEQLAIVVAFDRPLILAANP